jgi:putative ABC transport system permease protein
MNVTPLRQCRADKAHTSMFLRMLVRAAVLRRGRAATALLALVVAAAVTTAMLNLYVDVQVKLRKEFRNYGANVVVVGKNGAELSPGALAAVQHALAGKGLAVPFAYVVARTANGQSVVVAGTDLDEVRKLDTWWKVTPLSCACLTAPATVPSKWSWLGAKARALLTPNLQPFALSFQGRTVQLAPSAEIQTGAAEDSRVYLDLWEFEAWTGMHPSTIEVAANGTADELTALVANLSATLPDAEVRPVRQITEGEARVLGKTRATLLSATVLIILTSALCVLATLLGWVFDRRRDFAIMKALGASERLIGGFFAAEAAAMGAVGALVGFAIGIAVASWIGRINFNTPVVPRFTVLPAVVVGSVVVALVSSALPMSLLRRVQPAMILRGE